MSEIPDVLETFVEGVVFAEGIVLAAPDELEVLARAVFTSFLTLTVILILCWSKKLWTSLASTEPDWLALTSLSIASAAVARAVASFRRHQSLMSQKPDFQLGLMSWRLCM